MFFSKGGAQAWKVLGDPSLSQGFISIRNHFCCSQKAQFQEERRHKKRDSLNLEAFRIPIFFFLTLLEMDDRIYTHTQQKNHQTNINKHMKNHQAYHSYQYEYADLNDGYPSASRSAWEEWSCPKPRDICGRKSVDHVVISSMSGEDLEENCLALHILDQVDIFGMKHGRVGWSSSEMCRLFPCDEQLMNRNTSMWGCKNS